MTSRAPGPSAPWNAVEEFIAPERCGYWTGLVFESWCATAADQVFGRLLARWPGPQVDGQASRNGQNEATSVPFADAFYRYDGERFFPRCRQGSSRVPVALYLIVSIFTRRGENCT